MAASVVTASLVVATVGAYYALQGLHGDHARWFLRIGVTAGIASSLLVAFPTGVYQAKLLARYQPAALAAMEGHLESETGAGIVMIGRPNVRERPLDNPIVIPGFVSFLAYVTFHSNVKGLTEFPETAGPIPSSSSTLLSHHGGPRHAVHPHHGPRGLFALAAIVGHGATFLAWKSAGPVHDRSRRAAGLFYGAVAGLWPVLTAASWLVNATLLDALRRRPLAWLSRLLAMAGLVSALVGLRIDRSLGAFLGSCAFLAGILVVTTAWVFPAMLRSITDESASLTAYSSSAAAGGLATALRWWAIGISLAATYVVTLFRLHRGKVVAPRGREGY
jgi:cytochrome bd-type quinol oxidase subunit 1